MTSKLTPAVTQLTKTEPAVAELFANADHIDIKVVESEVGLREFIAASFSYMPNWIRALYTIRWGFVRLLGMQQDGIPQRVQVDPNAVSFTEGESAGFFKVAVAAEDRFYFSGATERHLTAYLGVVAEPTDGATRKYHVITIVKHHHWTGSLYFNVIRPFHHLVVGQMAKAGAKGVAVQLQPA